MTRIAILDYGMGNLRSVEKALEHVGADVVRTSDIAEAEAADGVILPGVGAFPRAMERIRELRFDQLISERVADGTPVFGICLGMQLLFESSTEIGGSEGLGLLRGEVTPLAADGLKVPHIGWSPLRLERETPLTAGIPSETPFYFVHSLAPRPVEPTDVLGTALYAERFVGAVERAPLYGAQFHPEKSSAAGLRMLGNFVAICAAVPASA